jgi:serine/threonine protein kinase
MTREGRAGLVEAVNTAIGLSGAERAAYMESLRASDPKLADVVARLVARHERGTGILLTPPDEGVAPRTGSGMQSAAPPAPGPPGPSRIGPYRLVRQIGEGGFGSVYLAEQESPVRRQVALKVIKLGMDTRAVIARFDAERRALALMDHAHIARVFDAGATETGRPYFVMELVRGEPITRYCDAHRLTIPERLALAEQICAAVQHAHQKGVIHRDLKPSNILVAMQDGRPIVKVIDFGIAKATGARLTERTLFTEHAPSSARPST